MQFSHLRQHLPLLCRGIRMIAKPRSDPKNQPRRQRQRQKKHDRGRKDIVQKPANLLRGLRASPHHGARLSQALGAFVHATKYTACPHSLSDL